MTADHSTCDHAWKQVTCDRCHRTYRCTPADDFYCTPCLLGGMPLHVVYIDQTNGDRP